MLQKPVLALFVSLLFASSIAAAEGASASHASLPGWAEGAEVIRVDAVRPQIDMITGVIFSQLKSTRAVKQLRMTLEIPRTKEKKPAVIYFPGGGFTSADHEKFSEMRRALAEAGFVVAAAEYRPVPAKFPALLEDAKAAVRYIRAHADEYGVDPNRIGILGDSAGGYLVEMAGATNGEKTFDKGDWTDVSSDVQAVVSIYGISDLMTIGEGFDAATQKVHESPAVSSTARPSATMPGLPSWRIRRRPWPRARSATLTALSRLSSSSTAQRTSLFLPCRARSSTGRSARRTCLPTISSLRMPVTAISPGTRSP